MDTLIAAAKLLERDSLSEYLNYQAYDPDSGIFTLNRTMGFIFECQPLLRAGHDSVASLRGLFGSALPVGAIIQVHMLASPEIDHILNMYVLYRESSGGAGMYSQIAGKRRDFYLSGGIGGKSLCRGFDYALRDFRLFVSVQLPVVQTPQGFEDGLTAAAALKNTVKQILRTASLEPASMDAEKLTNLLRLLLNPGHIPRTWNRYDNTRSISEQVLSYETILAVDQKSLQIDGKHVKSFSAFQYPEQWSVLTGGSYMGDLFSNLKQIPAMMMVTLTCVIPDQAKERVAFRKKHLWTKHQAARFGRISNDLVLREEQMGLLEQALQDQDEIVHGYMQVTLYGDNSSHIATLSSALTSYWRTMGIELQEDESIHLPMFMLSLPLGYVDDGGQVRKILRRMQTLTSRIASELAPIQSEWKGTGSPGFLLLSRRGQVQNVDLFDNRQGAKNGIIVAATGKGKSFLVNDIIMSYLGLGAKFWIIDVGRSYAKIADTFGGDMLSFSPDANVCINPFSRIASEKELLDEHMPVLKNILAQMASTQNVLSDLELSYLEEAIGNSYAQHGSDMTVTDVAEYLERGIDHQGRDRDLARMLYPYTSRGTYGRFFDGISNLNVKSNFTLLELEELKSKKDLQEVVLLSLIHLIQQELYLSKQRDIRKIVIIDEAWDLLGGQNTGKFMEDGYRRFRKYGGAAIAITQSIEDFLRTPAGRAMIANSPYRFFLQQERESVAALRKSEQVVLDDAELEMIMSVHTDPGNYSEIMALTPQGAGIGRLIVDRFTQLLYTTDSTEWAAIEKYIGKGMKLTDAIDAVIADERR